VQRLEKRQDSALALEGQEWGLPPCWADALSGYFGTESSRKLRRFVASERSEQVVFPPEAQLFSAFWATRLPSVRVVILGQDPYHDLGQAHGLAFSVPEGQKLPPSLRNIYKELAADLGVPEPRSGNLGAWAAQGVLLLNTVLTVRAHSPASHSKHGWEAFTDQVLSVLSHAKQPLVFVLWGAHAQRKRDLIQAHHVLIESPHPSPLSAHRGFFGSRPFTAINGALQRLGSEPIHWV
jgi:uracil-DNA glycosylase